MRNQASQSAHAVLQYMITRALMENKIGHTSIAIPATDINDPYDGYEVEDEAAHLVLKVTITTEWDEAGEEIESELHDGETGEPEEDGDKYGN